MPMTDTLRSLVDVLTPGQVITDPIELMTYETDASLDRGVPDAVVFPRSTEDVVKVIGWANEMGACLIARGAGTGLSGGAVAEHGGVIIGFSRMNKLLEFDEAGRSVVFEPGLVNLVLDEFAKARGLYYPPDPASGRTSTLGGNIAENAGGPHCFKYGVTTNYITGLEVVLTDPHGSTGAGRLVQLGGRGLDYPEYDLLGLMIGNEGTLGVITRASARLLRNTLAIKTMMVAFDSVEAAGRAVSAVIARGLVPATMEMMDQKIMRILEDYAHAGLPTHAGAALIIEADGYPESVTPQIEEIAAILREHGAGELRIAQSAEERDAIWYGRKSAAGAMARLAPAYYLVDGTVPRSKLAETLAQVNRLCEARDLQVGYVFHAGDGNLHPFILIPDPKDAALMARVHDVGKEFMQLCAAQDGSITGEHGVGSEKRSFMPLMYAPDELAVMAEIKQVFDPKNLLNPGKILPQELPPHRGPWAAAGPAPASPFAPATAQEASEAIRAWLVAGQRIRVRGGGTKSSLLPLADVTLSTTNLRGIKAYSSNDLYVTVAAGTPLAELQTELARDGMWAPLASPWRESTVGGIVATNFNAPLRMRYGAIRDVVLAATVAMADGRVIRAGRPVVKNVAGYDLPKLFVGSHGRLGLIADVSLKLAPLPRARSSLVTPVMSLAQGLEWGARLLRVCLVSSALLLCRGCTLRVPDETATYVLVYTAEGLPEDVAAELDEARTLVRSAGAAGVWQVDAPSGSDLWADWLRASSAQIVVRAGVAPKDLPRVTANLAGALGEAPLLVDFASGLLYTRGAPVDPTRQAALAAGGYAVVLSGEAADPWGYTPDSLDWMQALTARWDAGGLFNPGAFTV